MYICRIIIPQKTLKKFRNKRSPHGMQVVRPTECRCQLGTKYSLYVKDEVGQCYGSFMMMNLILGALLKTPLWQTYFLQHSMQGHIYQNLHFKISAFLICEAKNVEKIHFNSTSTRPTVIEFMFPVTRMENLEPIPQVASVKISKVFNLIHPRFFWSLFRSLILFWFC